jgi:hypothetical protein
MPSGGMVRIEISKSELVDGEWTPTTASALGLTARGRAPVLSLCRQLVAAGHDPAQPAEAYRGETLALRIRSLGEAAGLEVREEPTPRFYPYRPFPTDRVRRTGAETDGPLPT